jgi:hypothetical protein
MKKQVVAIVLVFALSIFTVTYAGAASAQAEPQPDFSEAYGAAAGASLYNTQVILGMTADAIVAKVYKNDEVKEIITEQKNILGVLDNYAGKLLKEASLKKDDRESLKDISACIAKLNATADSLLGYMANSSDAAANDFQVKRKASYAAIAKLLGIGQKKK